MFSRGGVRSGERPGAAPGPHLSLNTWMNEIGAARHFRAPIPPHRVAQRPLPVGRPSSPGGSASAVPPPLPGECQSSAAIDTFFVRADSGPSRAGGAHLARIGGECPH